MDVCHDFQCAAASLWQRNKVDVWEVFVLCIDCKAQSATSGDCCSCYTQCQLLMAAVTYSGYLLVLVLG